MSAPTDALDWAVRVADAAREAEGGYEDAEPEDDEVDEVGEALPPRPLGPPLGTRPWSPISAWPSMSSATSSPGLQQRGVELEQQLAATQAELEQARTERERAQAAAAQWRSAWRTTRIRSIADTIAFELQAARYGPALVQAAASAAAQAVGQLPDPQLGSPWAIDYGRQAASWVIASCDGDDELARARERRRWRPRPRARW